MTEATTITTLTFWDMRRPHERAALGAWEWYMYSDRMRRTAAFKLGRVKGHETAAVRDPALQAELERELVKAEATLERLRSNDMPDYLALHPAWPWLKQVKGIGPIYGFMLLATIGNAAWFINPSQLRRTAGIGMVDGKPQGGRVKGRKRHGGFYPLALSLALAMRRLLMSDGFYRWLYLIHWHRSVREQQGLDATDRDNSFDDLVQRKREIGSNMTAHKQAVLAVKRVFVEHLYGAWREALGLSLPLPYEVQYLHHAHIPYTDVLPWERERA